MNGPAAKPVAPYVLAAIVSVFLIVIAYVMFFVPKINESKSLVAQAETVRANNQALTAKADRVAATAGNLDPLKGQVKSFTDAFPAEARQQEMINAINAAASSSGITLTTLNPKVPEAAAGAEEPAAAPVLEEPAAEGAAAPEAAAPAEPSSLAGSIPLKVRGTGSLDAVKTFVGKIEKLQRPFMVAEVQIEQLEGKYSVTLSGKTFMSAPLTEPADRSGEDSK